MMRSTFSTTTMASSTTIPITSTMPNMVSTLIEKPRASKRGEGAQQRDRHHDGGDDGVAPVLQEQEHHQEHQGDGFEQGLGHLGDGDIHEARAVVRNAPAHAFWEVARELVHLGADCFCGLQRVATGRQLDADTHGGFAVQSRSGSVGLAAQLDARHILEANGGAIGVGPKNDVGELLDGRRAAR